MLEFSRIEDCEDQKRLEEFISSFRMSYKYILHCLFKKSFNELRDSEIRELVVLIISGSRRGDPDFKGAYTGEHVTKEKLSECINCLYRTADIIKDMIANIDYTICYKYDINIERMEDNCNKQEYNSICLNEDFDEDKE